MKRFYTILGGFLFAYMASSFVNIVFSENMQGNDAITEIGNTNPSTFSYGTVVSVDDYQIVISEYDYEKDEEIENTYIIDGKTEIKGVNSIAEIAVDDNVDILYSTVDDKKIAQSISVEKPSEDEDPPAETENTQTNNSVNNI